MENALRFFNPSEELENLKDLARAEYLNACDTIFAATGQYPEVEAIFPKLCNYVSCFGQTPWEPIVFQSTQSEFQDSQLEKLLALVETSFHTAPNTVHALIALPPKPNPVPSTSESSAVATQSNQSLSHIPAPAASPVPQVPSKPSTAPPQSRETPAIAAPKNDTPSAYDLAQTLLRSVPIRILGEAIFYHTGRYYRHITPDNLRRLILQYCRPAVARAGNCNLVESIYRVLLCEPDICDSQANFDPYRVSFLNGVLDLRTGRLYPHSPQFTTYYLASATYGCPGPHPTFDRFVDSIAEGDRGMRQRVLEIIGYCLVPDTNAKSFFVLQGVQDSGKSKFGQFIRDLFDRDASVALEISTLGDRFAAASLVGKQICLSMDSLAAPLKDATVSTFKKVTGGDPITADVKYRPPITFTNSAKFILASNHSLHTQFTDPAFYRRAVAIPFRRTVPLERQDANLTQKLLCEKDAIVYDAINAYFDLRKNHYRFSGEYLVNDMFSAVCKPAQQSVEEILKSFVQSSCVVSDQSEAFVEDLYQSFAVQFGESTIPSTQFGTRLLEVCQQLGLAVQRGPGSGKKRRPGGSSPIAYVTGISLRE